MTVSDLLHLSQKGGLPPPKRYECAQCVCLVLSLLSVTSVCYDYDIDGQLPSVARRCPVYFVCAYLMCSANKL